MVILVYNYLISFEHLSNILLFKTFEKMNNGEIMRLRYASLNYLQDVHVKVTVFIKEGLQRYNGSFAIIGKWAIPYGMHIKIQLWILVLYSLNYFANININKLFNI